MTAAHAEESRADALFAEGRAHMLAHEYEQACPLFAESLRLDPASGAALNLALCQERQGKLASAWRSYQTALSLAQGEHRPAQERMASQRLFDLDGRLSGVIVSVPGADQMPGLAVDIDGVAVPASAWGVRYALDGGKHIVHARAEGRADWQSDVTLADALDTSSVEVPMLAAAAPSPSPSPSSSSSSSPSSSPSPSPSSSSSSSSTAVAASPAVGEGAHGSSGPSRGSSWAFGAAGITVAAFGVGIYYGLEARSRWNERKQLCPQQQTVCGDAAVGAGHQAERSADIATTAFGVGIAGAALTGYLAWRFWPGWFATGGAGRPALSVTATGASVSLERTF